MMFTEKQIAAAEEAARKAAIAKRLAEENLMRTNAQYFAFGDVTWLANRLEKQMALDLEGGANKDAKKTASYAELPPIAEEWLQYRFSKQLRSAEFRMDVFEQAMTETLVDAEQPVSFTEFLQLLRAYQDLHLETDEIAGFSLASFENIKAQFEPYDKTGHGLQARELWNLLQDCGVVFTTEEDQNWMITMLKRVDKDCSGTIDVKEFCQLLRKVRSKREIATNAREADLVVRSGIPVSEVEEWHALYRRHHSEGRGLTLFQLHVLLNSIGIKWGSSGTGTLAGWVKEIDENADNLLDFGEFCCLIQKMVKEDFQGTRSATKEFMHHDSVSSTTSSTVRWSEDRSIALTTITAKRLPSRPKVVIAPRVQVERDLDMPPTPKEGVDYERYFREMEGKQHLPLSPTLVKKPWAKRADDDARSSASATTRASIDFDKYMEELNAKLAGS